MSHAFRSAVENADLEAVEAALHPDVVFRSPAVFKAYEGREATIELLRNVLEVFEDFRYIEELSNRDGTGHGLVFEARVGDKHLQGWDYLRVDEDGLITELTVMVRPLSGLMALAQAMAERLSAPAG